MAQSIEIRHFRCFETAKLPDCRRINIFVGDNGSGKTAAMEAIFLASCTGPEIAIRMRNWRGLEGPVSGQARSISRGLWGDLFHNYDFKKNAAVIFHGSKAHTRELNISYHERNILVSTSKKSVDTNWSPVTFTWKGHNNRLINAVTPRLLADGKVEIPPSPESQIESSFYAANHTYSSSETANRFSELSKQSKAAEVIEHFTRQFPNVEELSIEMHAGTAMVFAKLRDLEEKLPLNLVSGGINKLAAILFAIPNHRDGMILIDEIDNGFYYKKLPEIWKSILHFANLYEVQIFASTHSLECLQAVEVVAADNPNSFSVIHCGKGKLQQFSGERFVGAMEENIEVR